MIDTQAFFTAKARGQDAPFPNRTPPDAVGDDAAAAFDAARADTLRAFAEPDAAEKLGIGVAATFGDALIHGWDLATATGQDATMPEGLAEKAYEAIHGNFTDENRQGIFGPEVTVAADAPPQEKLLAYSGRTPS